MSSPLEVLVGILTVGLPFWFAYLDQKSLPKLRWIDNGHAPPVWGRLVVVVGVTLAILIAMAAPVSVFDPSH